MKKRLKKSAAALLVSAMAVSGGAAYAAPNADVQQDQEIQAELISAITNYGVTINGENAKNNGFMNQESKQVMLPLREIAEALGYDLKWNKEARSTELTKPNTPVWSLVQTDKDEYNENKMLVKLGAAPVNILGTLYVPAQYFSDVLHHGVVIEGAQVSVTTGESEAEDAKTVKASGVITAVYNEEDRKAAHINGAGPDGIILNVDENTVILNAAGEKIELKDLSLGLDINVVHSLAMTMSLPGQTYAYEIKVKQDSDRKDLLGTSGTITPNEDGSRIKVTGIGMTEASPKEVVLNLSADTVIVDQDGKDVKATDLKKDDKVLAFYGPMLTKSLPPIGGAVKIVVMK
ncbi:copper amine oxidase N-terminal domain-containing protein [Paenibacillus dakarensis]|uniref:copper amine oxidase N-terminal domain-containing protein n=1 Tax=Paenibacillus dakarensis TaxID=1527293 RepID=UPI0006D585A0|nr:copper amine oxidase N-terminal domain-containing protein [Paenibacillus dakarensis]